MEVFDVAARRYTRDSRVGLTLWTSWTCLAMPDTSGTYKKFKTFLSPARDADLRVSLPSCSIKVVAKAFEGKNAINRQRMVFKCIWEEMQTDKVSAATRRSILKGFHHP
jgi:hypothetical protein